MIPSLSVVQTVPSRRRNEAPALSSPPNPIEPSTSPLTNHLNPTGTSTSRRPSPRDHAIDHAADETSVLPTPTSPRQPRAPPNRYAMAAERMWFGLQQPGARRDHAMAVGVGVVAEGDIEPVAQRDQPGHRERRRGVHPDLAVPVDGHEPERRVDRLVRRRSGRARSARRSRPSRRPRRRPSGRRRCCRPERAIAAMSMTDARSPTYVARKSWPTACWRARSMGTRLMPSIPSAPEPSSSRLASSWIQPVTSVSAGPPSGGLYLKPPSSGGLCDGVTTIPSASPRRPAVAVRDDDGVRHGRGGRVAVARVHADVDPVGDQDLEGGPLRRV